MYLLQSNTYQNVSSYLQKIEQSSLSRLQLKRSFEVQYRFYQWLGLFSSFPLFLSIPFCYWVASLSPLFSFFLLSSQFLIFLLSNRLLYITFWFIRLSYLLVLQYGKRVFFNITLTSPMNLKNLSCVILVVPIKLMKYPAVLQVFKYITENKYELNFNYSFISVTVVAKAILTQKIDLKQHFV